MSAFTHGLIRMDGHSPHELLVALGLEAADHSTGILCPTAQLNGTALVLDDATVYETGQAAGQLSNLTQVILAGNLWRTASADLQTLRQYAQLAGGAATLAQTQAAVQAIIRALRWLVSR